MKFPCKTDAFQMYSFWLLKGLLLQSKRTPFASQKYPFCNAKGLHFSEHCYFVVITLF